MTQVDATETHAAEPAKPAGLKFSANISMLFKELPPLQRPMAARDAGFDGIEIQFPYDHPADAWQRAIADSGLPLVLFNVPTGDMMSGGPGLACMPGRERQFEQALHEALRYAALLKPLRVNVLAGCPPPPLDREQCLEVLANNLRLAAQSFQGLDIGVMFEPLNTFDRPAYLVATSQDAWSLLARTGHPNLSIQHDLYHMQMMEGRLVPTLERLLSHVGHIQFADVPGRHEPGTGEMNFPNLFAALSRMGWNGFVGAEYVPSGRTEDTLAWLHAARNER
jgi:hydroxypyruvate isomerase